VLRYLIGLLKLRVLSVIYIIEEETSLLIKRAVTRSIEIVI
jgi:hypothetical protein